MCGGCPEGLQRLPKEHNLKCQGSEGVRQVKGDGVEERWGKDSRQVAAGARRQQRGVSAPPSPCTGLSRLWVYPLGSAVPSKPQMLSPWSSKMSLGTKLRSVAPDLITSLANPIKQPCPQALRCTVASSNQRVLQPSLEECWPAQPRGFLHPGGGVSLKPPLSPVQARKHPCVPSPCKSPVFSTGKAIPLEMPTRLWCPFCFFLANSVSQGWF